MDYSMDSPQTSPLRPPSPEYGQLSTYYPKPVIAPATIGLRQYNAALKKNLAEDLKLKSDLVTLRELVHSLEEENEKLHDTLTRTVNNWDHAAKRARKRINELKEQLE